MCACVCNERVCVCVCVGGVCVCVMEGCVCVCVLAGCVCECVCVIARCVCVCVMEVGVEQEGLEECQDHTLTLGRRNNLGPAGKASSGFP